MDGYENDHDPWMWDIRLEEWEIEIGGQAKEG